MWIWEGIVKVLYWCRVYMPGWMIIATVIFGVLDIYWMAYVTLGLCLLSVPWADGTKNRR